MMDKVVQLDVPTDEDLNALREFKTRVLIAFETGDPLVDVRSALILPGPVAYVDADLAKSSWERHKLVAEYPGRPLVCSRKQPSAKCNTFISTNTHNKPQKLLLAQILSAGSLLERCSFDARGSHAGRHQGGAGPELEAVGCVQQVPQRGRRRSGRERDEV